ncbi:alpha/beta fold hydrolase [Microbacterium hydrocarbonoxydans]|uniref:alpha/beta fold hydrolase n=1 Tax=Microbacterium hydrocarbonoxydans TaxID=273678 RepID=UPI0007BB2D68|nr:alpha/beta fold hydrolase [Microbacterium hydrocarbonoxydans]GAT71798.1 hydrolase [Microbacterium sp. HM58-2]
MASHDLGEVTLDYAISGDDGPLVVQLHGLTSSRERDAELGLDLARSVRGHRVLRYDARGHGRSTGSSEPADYGWDRLSDDLLSLLDRVAPGERVHGVGPSMGTGTLLHAAVREPDRFRSLTFAVPPTAWKTRAARADVYRGNAALVERDGVEGLVELARLAPTPPALAGSATSLPEVAPALLPTVFRGAAATDLPPRADISGLRIPTLILAWTGDRAHPLKTARRLHALIPDSRLVIARTPYDIMAWPGLFAEHVTGGDRTGAGEMPRAGQTPRAVRSGAGNRYGGEDSPARS